MKRNRIMTGLLAVCLLFSLLPFIVATLNARRATDDDSFLPFKTGILFVALFVVAAAPLSTFPHLRFWAWTAREVVPSGFLLALAVMALAITFTLALAVMAFDVWCRDHRRIALQRFPELIEDGETGLLYESGNPEDLADKIEQALKDPALSRKIAAKGQECAIEKYDIRKYGDMIYELYKSVLS